MPIFTPTLHTAVDYADLISTKEIESDLQRHLPPHTLMARAGLSASQLAKALAPHARSVWIACGPGNNGGDGLVAAVHIQKWMQAVGGTLWVSVDGNETSLPHDAQWALQEAKAAGITFSMPPMDQTIDLGLDALLGIGTSRTRRTEPSPIPSNMAELRRRCAALLCIDTPSDLNPFTGSARWPGIRSNPKQLVQTLTLLTFKPGLTTGLGRDLAGPVWLDPLEPNASAAPAGQWVPPAIVWPTDPRRHASHKGTHGDVWILGGQTTSDGPNMLGAIVLAGRAALSAGAGRATVIPVNSSPGFHLDPVCPELMVCHQHPKHALQQGTWVAGCGGGTAISEWIPQLLASNHPVVLDADALNQIAANDAFQIALKARKANGAISVITPHPLEAARLLKTSAESIQNDRLAAAHELSHQFQCICVLKGSGTVISSPGSHSWINGTGNSSLATAGTGDVLAGLLGGAIARIEKTISREFQWQRTLEMTLQVVHAHGLAADTWPSGHAFSTSSLPNRAGYLLRGSL